MNEAIDSETAWWAWKAGWVPFLAMLAFFLVGAGLMKRRGYIVKRWPRLDVGFVWAWLSIAVGGVASLLPIAVDGHLDASAIKAQLGLAIGVLIRGSMDDVKRHEEEKRAEAPGVDPPA